MINITPVAESDNQADRAYHELRRRILIAEIRPEQRLIERTWAEVLQLGRLAVREALTRLHGEGLLARAPKGGFLVAPMTEIDVHELRELRESLEVSAVRLAASRITPDQLRELETLCQDFAFMAAKGYETGALEADRRFHELLVAASGNKRLQQAYERCNLPLFQVPAPANPPEEFSQTDSEHRAIVDALKRGDVDKAVEWLRIHLARGEQDVISALPRFSQQRPGAS